MKKIWILLLAMIFTISCLVGCGNSDSGAGNSQEAGSLTADESQDSDEGQGVDSNVESDSSEEPYELTFMFIASSTPEDMAKVEEEVNKLTMKELNMKVNLETVTFANWHQQVQLMLSGGESLDVFPVNTTFVPGYIQNGYLVNMSDLIDQYGTNIKTIMGEDYCKVANFSGFVYGVPTMKEWCNPSGWVMRQDILDEIGVDAESLTSWDAMTDVFAKVHEAHPDMTVIGGYRGSTPVASYTSFDRLQDCFGVLEDYGQTTTVTNIYASEEYYNLCKQVREWYQAGYMLQDMATATDNGDALMKAGNTFCYYTYLKPDSKQERDAATGYDTACVYNTQPLLESCVMTTPAYGIGYGAKDPEKCMQFLDWAFGSSEFETLIMWGMEGDHWVYEDEANNIVTWPEGVDITNCGYHVGYGFSMPNQQVAALWSGNHPGVWESYVEMHDNAIRSKAFGFQYDPSGLETEIAALTSVKNEYEAALGSGSVDPDEVIPQFIQALEDAGIEKVMAEKQKQLDEWLETQN